LDYLFFAKVNQPESVFVRFFSQFNCSTEKQAGRVNFWRGSPQNRLPDLKAQESKKPGCHDPALSKGGEESVNFIDTQSIPFAAIHNLTCVKC